MKYAFLNAIYVLNREIQRVTGRSRAVTAQPRGPEISVAWKQGQHRSHQCSSEDKNHQEITGRPANHTDNSVSSFKI